MASYGFQVFNDTGSVQIDDQYKNLALTAQAPFSFNRTGTVTVTGVAPIIAWQSAQAIVLIRTVSSANQHTFTLFSEGTASGTYFVFDEPSVMPRTETYGLLVFNEQGAVTFSSEYRYARVRDFVLRDAGTAARDYGAGSYAVTHGAYPKRVLVTRPGGSGEGAGAYVIVQFVTGFFTTTTGIGSLEMTYRGFSVPAGSLVGAPPGYTRSEVLVLDVAGF